jgi:periplasmic copper chaperone A
VSRTARRPRRVLVPTALSLLAAASLVLSGCAAGQYAQTAAQVASIDGANGTIGNIAVLNARLAPTEREKYPAGSNARLLLWISNDSVNPDALSSVSTSAASSVKITGDPAVPGQTLADFATDQGTQVTVTGFLQDQFYGQSIPVTFNFKNAGALSLNIPIQIPEQRSTDRPTVDIQPAHPTPIWEQGEAGAAETTGESGH